MYNRIYSFVVWLVLFSIEIMVSTTLHLFPQNKQ